MPEKDNYMQEVILNIHLHINNISTPTQRFNYSLQSLPMLSHTKVESFITITVYAIPHKSLTIHYNYCLCYPTQRFNHSLQLLPMLMDRCVVIPDLYV